MGLGGGGGGCEGREDPNGVSLTGPMMVQH